MFSLWLSGFHRPRSLKIGNLPDFFRVRFDPALSLRHSGGYRRLSSRRGLKLGAESALQLILIAQQLGLIADTQG